MTELLEELRCRDIRLWRDGGNLRFNAPPGALTPELKSRIAAHKAELLAHFASEAEQSAPSATEIIPVADRSGDIPLSFAQERLWVLDRLEPGLTAYNVAQCWRITGSLDTGALERALQEIERRHENLRTTFPPREDGMPVQAIGQPGAFVLHRITAAPDSLRWIAESEMAHRFDLSTGPLWRATLVQLGPDDHALLVTWHHIICDAWSAGIFARELTALHSAFRLGQPSPLAELPLQFADCAVWQRKKCEGSAMDSQLAFWRKQLGGDRAPLSLPADRPRPARQSYRGGLRTHDLPAATAAGLKELARAEGVTLFIITLAAFQALLARISGETDICVGSPIAQRPNAESEGLLGFFLNMLALRTDLSGDPDFREVLRRVRASALSGFQHQDVPFEKVVEELHPSRDLSHQPIFQVAFVLQPPGETAPAFNGTTVTALPPAVDTAKFDLTLFLEETPGGMRAMMEYSADQFDASTADRMLGWLEFFLRGIIAAPATPLSRLPILGDAERARLLNEWSGSERPYAGTQTVAERFSECAARTPEAIAIVEEGNRVTYAELDARSNRVANFLRSKGVRTGDFVGLHAGRSAAFVVQALGIAKTGGAYLPLDGDEPPARLAAMRAKCTAVLEDEPPQGESPAPAASGSTPGSAAYVLFTSGSTGVPKGVVVPHSGIMRLVVNNDYAPFEPCDVVAFASNVCFDAATFEIWGALLNGGTLVITPRDTLLSPDALQVHLERHRISVMFLTTSLFNRLAHESPAMFGRLRMLVFGGEAADAASVRLVLANGRPQRLVNGYGPTETTTFAVCHTIADAPGATVPIGRPIANTRVFILDPAMQPVPQGVTGEIFIGGPGVALGYHGAPDLTAEKFQTTDYGRLYRTGDLARWLADGTIEYLGRRDAQLKLRGFRIEPGEIETALQQHPAVRHAAINVRTEDGRASALVAYLVMQAGPRTDDAVLREFLSARVPAYMIPSAFVRMDSLPLTPNGKLDTRRLPAPEATSADSATAVLPSDERERTLAAIWERALGRRATSVFEDFFTVGGHSLLALRLLSEVRQKFGIEVPARRLFETPTIAGLAEFLSQNETPAPADSKFLVSVQRGNPSVRPLFLIPGGWGGEIEFLVYGELSRQIDPTQPIWGLKARGAGTGDAPHGSVAEMAADYIREIRRVQPHGPYLIAGECVGGICAHEIACQLDESGENVALLMLLDTVVPNEAHLKQYLDAEAEKRAAEAQQFTLSRRIRHHLSRMSGLSLRGKFGYIFQKLTRQKTGAPASAADEPQPAPAQHPRGQKDYPVTLLRHRVRNFRGTVTLLVDEESSSAQREFGWEKVSATTPDTHIIPGTHLTCIREHAATAAAKIRELLARTHSHIAHGHCPA